MIRNPMNGLRQAGHQPRVVSSLARVYPWGITAGSWGDVTGSRGCAPLNASRYSAGMTGRGLLRGSRTSRRRGGSKSTVLSELAVLSDLQLEVSGGGFTCRLECRRLVRPLLDFCLLVL